MEYRIITHNIILMSLVWAFGFVCNSDSNSRFRERKFVKHTAYMFGLKMAFAQKSRRARCCRGIFCAKNIHISGIFHSNLRKNMKTFSTTTLCNQKKKQTTKCRRQKPERLATLRTGISSFRGEATTKFVSVKGQNWPSSKKNKKKLSVWWNNLETRPVQCPKWIEF